MPPYAYDQHFGIQDLKGDWRLDQEEIDTVVAWVNDGAPLGPTDVVPPQPQFPDPDEWNFAAALGQPDAIIPSSPYDIPANGNDQWSKVFVDPGITESRCIKAVQVKPRGDARAVVHHANSDVYIHNESGALEEVGQLTEYAMGKWGELMPEGVRRTLPANAMTQGFHSFDHPVRIDGFQPHGHLRMNAASLAIFDPETGRTTAVNQISNWSATWHHSHIYEPDVGPLLKPGQILVIKQWYDNSVGNPNNPDPDQWVCGGSRTGDEMSHAWIALTHLDQAGYEKILAERNAREQRSLAGSD